MNNQLINFQTNKKYDLEERTALFGIAIIKLVKKLELSPINKRMIEQIIGSAGSVGANYCEANESESRKDFIHKIGICKKEAKETLHWLRLLAEANAAHLEELKALASEAQELLLIFSAINRSAKNKKLEY